MNLSTFCKLARIQHAFMLALATLTAEVIVAGVGGLQLQLALLSLVPPFFIGAASFVLNDYFDVEADKKNKRFERPLVSGKAKKTEALAAAIVLFAVGVASSFFVNSTAFAIAVVFALLAIAYNWKLKDLPLVGNAYIAASMAIALVYGNFVVSSRLTDAVLVISLVAFLAGLAREIVKTVQDMEGDRKARKANTLPFVVGVEKCLALSLAFYALAIALSVSVFFYVKPFAFNFAYLAPVLAADLLFAFAAVLPIKKQSKENFEASRKYSLRALALGLASFLAGTLVKI